MLDRSDNISGDELAKVILACKKAGVIQLKWSDVEVKFGLEKVSGIQELAEIVKEGQTIVETESSQTPEQLPLPSQLEPLSDQELENEDNLIISDPVAWELRQMGTGVTK